MLDVKTISNHFFKKQIEAIENPNAKIIFENSIGYILICGVLMITIAISYLTIAIIIDLDNYEVTAYSICALYPILAAPMVIIIRKAMKKATLNNDDVLNETLISRVKSKNRLLLLILTVTAIIIIVLSIFCF